MGSLTGGVQKQKKRTMLVVYLALGFLIATPPLTWAKCECSDLTIYDERTGRIIGNCLVRDEINFWCYIKATSRCSDTQRSSRSFDLYWSYQPCFKAVPRQDLPQYAAGT